MKKIDSYLLEHKVKGEAKEIDGAYLFIQPDNRSYLRVIASEGGGWDHVSVSLGDRCPTWQEMDDVFRLFFRLDETAIQLHVPRSEHINNFDFCLHLWRNQDTEIAKPPTEFV